jgi:hypothetical protein
MLNNALIQSKAKLLVVMLLSVGLFTTTILTKADERESLEQLKATTTNLIDLLVKEGVLPKDKADAMMKKAAQDAAQQVKQAKAKEAASGENGAQENSAQEGDKSVRVQYVPEHVKKEMRAEIEKEVMENLNYKAGDRLGLPSWIDRIAFNGDMRLRYERDNFFKNNNGAFTPLAAFDNVDRNGNNLSNSSEDRNRLRIRARLGADLKVNEWLIGGLRLTTGTLTDPVSPNQTESISQGKYTIALDRAFLKASPYDWLELQGGRFGNPFFSTDLVWDPDLAFDGVAATFTPKLNDTWSSFSTVGAFPIEEIQSSEVNKAKSKWLYALQTGIQWKAQNKSIARLGIAYYDYKNVEGQSNPSGLDSFNATVPAFRQRGNNTFNINTLNGGLVSSANQIGLASKFELVDLTGQVDLLTFDPAHVTLTGDYVKNIGFDANEIFSRTGKRFNDETDGYQVRLDVGNNSFNGGASTEIKSNDWSVMLGYKYIQADAVLDAFTDSDFHLGGTDAKGWLLGGNYAVGKNAWVSARYFSADTISGLPLSVDVLLVDFNAKF